MNALAPIAPSELVITIERARALLDEGDIRLALRLSSVAYDQARAAADTAEKVKASRELVDKARRMQADALKIESMCYVAMADAVDAAQAKGQIARQGQRSDVQGSDMFTLEDAGIDRRRLSEARQLRNAVREEPGFVDRVIEVRMAEGVAPSRASLRSATRHAIGTRSATDAEKGDQLYETPQEATRTLIALEGFSATFKEPFVGRGAILRVMEAAGYEGVISDLRDRGTATRHGELQAVEDFLTSLPGETCGMDIVTNPPYGDLANKCLARALRVHKPAKMAALLNLNFQCGFDDPDRCYVMDENPPSRVYTFIRRLPMMHRDGWDGPKATSQMNTAWFVWERNPDGSYGRGRGRFETIRVDWKDFQDAAPIAPGARLFLEPEDFPEAEEDFARSTPRKTVDERVEEEFRRAAEWIAARDAVEFDYLTFRRGVAVRDRVAAALLQALAENGVVEAVGESWRAVARLAVIEGIDSMNGVSA